MTPGLPSTLPMPIEAYHKRLAEIEAGDQAIEAAISARSAPFRARAQPITVASVQAALPEGAALVEWTVYRPFHPRAGTPQAQWGPPRYAACVLPSQGAPACVDLGEAKPVEAAVTGLRRALGRAAGKNVQELARGLDALVMAPVRKLLGETRWVFLSPDGALTLVALRRFGGRGRTLPRRVLFVHVPDERSRSAAAAGGDAHHPGLLVAHLFSPCRPSGASRAVRRDPI